MTFRLRHLAGSLACALCAFGAVSSTAQAQSFGIDVGTFAYDDDESLLEIYLAFKANTVPFEADTLGVFRGSLPVGLELNRSSVAVFDSTTAGPVWADAMNLGFSIADTSAIQPGQNFVHQMRVPVEPGEYELTVRRLEADGTPTAVQRDVVVPDYATSGQVQLSALTLASQIIRSQDRENPFYKNGLVINPNPNQLFGRGLTKLYYYTEAYGVDQALQSDSTYTTYAFVTDGSSSLPVFDLSRRTTRLGRPTDVIVGTFDLADVPSGSYVLNLVLLNADNEAIVEQNQKFFVYNPEVEQVAQAGFVDQEYETSLFAGMPEDEIEENIDHIKVIATDRERRAIGDLASIDDKRQYLVAFWRKRDTDPTTAGNEGRQDFYSRLQYVKERYSTARREGWKTDRGRIVLKYGIPSNIDPKPYDRQLAPHEIWEYNNLPGQGRALFIFADMDGFNVYELLHTTVPGERQDPNWQTTLARRRR